MGPFFDKQLHCCSRHPVLILPSRPQRKSIRCWHRQWFSWWIPLTTLQHLPPAIEDSHEEFFGPGSGWFQGFLLWDPVELKGDVRDTHIRFVLFAHHLHPARRYYSFFDIPDQGGHFGDLRGQYSLFCPRWNTNILSYSSSSNCIRNNCKRPQLSRRLYKVYGSNKLPGVGDDAVSVCSLTKISFMG